MLGRNENVDIKEGVENVHLVFRGRGLGWRYTFRSHLGTRSIYIHVTG